MVHYIVRCVTTNDVMKIIRRQLVKITNIDVPGASRTLVNVEGQS